MDYLLSASTSCSSIDERTEVFFNSADFKVRCVCLCVYIYMCFHLT